MSVKGIERNRKNWRESCEVPLDAESLKIKARSFKRTILDFFWTHVPQYAEDPYIKDR